MKYDFPVYRPPSESFSLIIQTTIGCPYNKCRFCFMYKDKRFSVREVEDIKEDIISAKMHHGEHVRTIFLADGNSVIMRTHQLVEILNLCYAIFPSLERVTSYGAARFILKTKTTEELEELRRAGLTRIHMGLESGDDDILSEIQKGATAHEMVKASLMVKEAGMELSQYVLLGIGGARNRERHAHATAGVLSSMDPDFIRVRTLVLKPGAPLYEDWLAGGFTLCTPLQVLKETRILLEELDVNSHFFSDHVSNFANINGRLPRDRDAMLAELEKVRKRVEGDPEYSKWLANPERFVSL